MAYSNCCNGSGNCGSFCGSGYARRNDNSWYRNSYAALNAIPSCTRRNYPFYTGNCPNEWGCYNCGCMAGVTNQNYRWGGNGCCGCGNTGCDDCNNCGGCNPHNGCNNCGTCDVCGGCGTCHDNCNDPYDHCGCNGCTNCNECPHHDCHKHRHCPVYGLFSAGVPISVTAGAAIPLTTTSVSNNDFTVSGGTVTINRCGTYLATYTVNLPVAPEAGSTTIMNVNGVAQPSTLLNLTDAGSYTAQTVFTANRGTTISIVSNTALTVADPAGQNIVTLTLTRID